MRNKDNAKMKWRDPTIKSATSMESLASTGLDHDLCDAITIETQSYGRSNSTIQSEIDCNPDVDDLLTQIKGMEIDPHTQSRDGTEHKFNPSCFPRRTCFFQTNFSSILFYPALTAQGQPITKSHLFGGVQKNWKFPENKEESIKKNSATDVHPCAAGKIILKEATFSGWQKNDHVDSTQNAAAKTLHDVKRNVSVWDQLDKEPRRKTLSDCEYDCESDRSFESENSAHAELAKDGFFMNRAGDDQQKQNQNTAVIVLDDEEESNTPSWEEFPKYEEKEEEISQLGSESNTVDYSDADEVEKFQALFLSCDVEELLDIDSGLIGEIDDQQNKYQDSNGYFDHDMEWIEPAIERNKECEENESRKPTITNDSAYSSVVEEIENMMPDVEASLASGRNDDQQAILQTVHTAIYDEKEEEIQHRLERFAKYEGRKDKGNESQITANATDNLPSCEQREEVLSRHLCDTDASVDTGEDDKNCKLENANDVCNSDEFELESKENTTEESNNPQTVYKMEHTAVFDNDVQRDLHLPDHSTKGQEMKDLSSNDPESADFSGRESLTEKFDASDLLSGSATSLDSGTCFANEKIDDHQSLNQTAGNIECEEEPTISLLDQPNEIAGQGAGFLTDHARDQDLSRVFESGVSKKVTETTERFPSDGSGLSLLRDMEESTPENDTDINDKQGTSESSNVKTPRNNKVAEFQLRYKQPQQHRQRRRKRQNNSTTALRVKNLQTRMQTAMQDQARATAVGPDYTDEMTNLYALLIFATVIVGALSYFISE